MAGFAITAVGVATGFFSFYIDKRWLGIIALAIAAIGIVIGFAGVAYGWIYDGKRAFKESIRGMKELRAKLHGK